MNLTRNFLNSLLQNLFPTLKTFTREKVWQPLRHDVPTYPWRSLNFLVQKTKELLTDRHALTILLMVLVSSLLTLPFLEKIPNHPDDAYAFYKNLSNLWQGKGLANYYHVALAEDLLFGFLKIIGRFRPIGLTSAADATPVTFYYGRLLCFLIYLAGFATGAFLIQGGEKKVARRTVVFALLYFSSLGVFERFLRLNTDSLTMIIFFLFVAFSARYLPDRMTILRSFLLNTLFLFLSLFTNVKSLYLLLPVTLINTLIAFNRARDQLTQSFFRYAWWRLPLYGMATIFTVIALWLNLTPQPFKPDLFLDNTAVGIVEAARSDLWYSIQSGNSWRFYLYDTLTEYVGLPTLLAFLSLTFVYLFVKRKQKSRPNFTFSETKKFNWRNNPTELLLLISFLTYYFGLANNQLHWSRWGLPLGLITIIFMSLAAEKFLANISLAFGTLRTKILAILFLGLPLLLLVTGLRLVLTYDLYQTQSDLNQINRQTQKDIENFLAKEGLNKEAFAQKAAHHMGNFTPNLGYASLDDLNEKKFKQIEYLIVVPWDLGKLFTQKPIDLGAINQQKLLSKIAERVTYRFPTLISRYNFYTRSFLWNELETNGYPESDLMIDATYAVVKLKRPLPDLSTSYQLDFNHLSHFDSSFSTFFNSKNFPKLKHYLLPPCYFYPDVKTFNDGQKVAPPPELGGEDGRTAGRTCQSHRARYLYKGRYQVKIEGLAKKAKEQTLIFAGFPFDWDPGKQLMTFELKETLASGEFGVATVERKINGLTFSVDYQR